jgi:hypothetical protein
LSEALEVAIRDLLLSEGSSERVAQLLIPRLLVEASRKERNAFVNFLIHAGLIKEAFEFYKKWIKEKLSFRMMPFLLITHHIGIKPDPQFLNFLFLMRSEFKDEDQFHQFLSWESVGPRLIEIKENQRRKLSHDVVERKAKHLEKLEYYRNSRMIEEEERFLNEMIKMYPEDERLQSDRRSFKERWARAILAKNAIDAFDDSAEGTEPFFTSDELTVAKIITQAVKELVKSHPKKAYDFAIGFYFIELYQDAFEVLNLSESDAASDWFRIELMLKTRRFVEALDSLTHIENKYAHDPETVFGTTYYRAITLQGLGQQSAAIELLASLVHIRPNYRSAHSLLLKWKSSK